MRRSMRMRTPWLSRPRSRMGCWSSRLPTMGLGAPTPRRAPVCSASETVSTLSAGCSPSKARRTGRLSAAQSRWTFRSGQTAGHRSGSVADEAELLMLGIGEVALKTGARVLPTT